MESFVLRVGDQEYRLALPSEQIAEAERQLGGISVIDMMSEVQKTGVQAVLLWAALQKYNHGYHLKKAYGLIDSMRENGCEFQGKRYEEYDFETVMSLYFAIIGLTGFFPKEMVEEMDRADPLEPSQSA